MIVLHSNVLSALMRPDHEAIVVDWLNAQPRPSIWTTSVTVLELRSGVQLLPKDKRRDAFNEALPPLKDFILPGGGEAAARCHVARTVVRRAERETVALSRLETVRPEAIRYLNRLSDLLFVLARVLARASGHGEVLWQHERRKG